MNKSIPVFPEPGAIVTDVSPSLSDQPVGLTIQRIPLNAPANSPVLELVEIAESGNEPDSVIFQTQTWVEAASTEPTTPLILVTLPGARVFWVPGRAAIIASSGRAESVRNAVLEFARVETEIRRIELELADLWPQLEADSPLAFEFAERSVRGRKHLAKRFARVIALRAALARLTPRIMLPTAHPPTLSAQVGERLRDRARLVPRLEFLEGGLEVFERVYDACAQRSSDYMLARRGHALEWVIIVLLLSQIVLVSVEMLSSAGK